MSGFLKYLHFKKCVFNPIGLEIKCCMIKVRDFC